MKGRDDELRWIPLWIDKWLFGSTRIELQPDERSVWIDLMVLSSKDRGNVRANIGVAYPFPQLAGMLCISEELLRRTIDRCKDPKIAKIIQNEDGTLFLPNWQEYQLSPRHKRRFVPGKEEMSPKEDIMSPKADTPGSTEDTIGEERRGEEKKEKEKEPPNFVFQCEFFEIDKSYHYELVSEFPAIDFQDLFIRLRNDCKDNPLRYKKNVHGHIKNLRNAIRNWCLRANPSPGNFEKPVKSDPAKVKCKFCGEIFGAKEDHRCPPT